MNRNVKLIHSFNRSIGPRALATQLVAICNSWFYVTLEKVLTMPYSCILKLLNGGPALRSFFVDFQMNLVVNALDRFPFYLLPTRKQQMYALILNRIQNGASIRMGPFLKLHFAATTQVHFSKYAGWKIYYIPNFQLISFCCSLRRQFIAFWCAFSTQRNEFDLIKLWSIWILYTFFDYEIHSRCFCF